MPTESPGLSAAGMTWRAGGRSRRPEVLIVGDAFVRREVVTHGLTPDCGLAVLGSPDRLAGAIEALREHPVEALLSDAGISGAAEAIRLIVVPGPRAMVLTVAIPGLDQAVLAFADVGVSGLGRVAPLAPATAEPWSALTAREGQVLELIADGLSNKEIAHRLVIEVATVKNHVHHILEKLHVGRRGEAAARLRVRTP